MRHRLNTARLAQLLAASRISQNHWAQKLGFSRGHWSDIVNGRHVYMSLKTRERMTEVFAVNDLFIPEASGSTQDVDFRIAISGRYELSSELGHGGMGIVYLANDLALGRLIALKVVASEAVAGIGAEQLLQEITTVARLQHPNILPLFDAGTGAGSPFYVMPYIRGGSLGARIQSRGRLPVGEVTGLVREIAAGLSHAHTHRVLHCDIKPENILLDGAHPYVMDFGIARKLHTEANEWIGVRKELDFSAGTPAYVSPEQAAGDRVIDERSDVYSLACVVYEMLTARAAFAGSNTQEIVSLRFREAPPPLRDFAPDVPAGVARAIERAMSLDPDRRPASAVGFASELSHAAASASPLRTTVSVAISRTHHWVRSSANMPAARGGMLRRFTDALWQDIVYGFRQRRRAPGLAAVALLTLALTLGLTTAVFALIDGAMLRPLPFARPDRLVALESMDSVGTPIEYVSAPNWFDWKHDNHTLDGAAIYMTGRYSVLAGGNAVRVESGWVSPEFFRVLGVQFIWGRGFDSAEVSAGRGGAVVSEGFWRRELGASRDSSLVIQVNGYPTRVIGVIARDQEFPFGAAVWTAYPHRQFGGGVRNNINWHAVGRLKASASIADARTDLSAIARRVHAAEPVALYSYGVNVIPLQQQLVGKTTSLLGLLTGSVVIVLLIGCANLASANLAQGSYREREMAVRSALGAGRLRLVRQVLVDNVMLALVGGTAGLALAWVLIRAASAMGAAELPRIAGVSIDARVMVIAFALSMIAGVVTGLLPALQASRAAPNDVIGSRTRSVVFGGRGLPGRVLVGAEIAMALTLVAAAGLLLRSLNEVLSQPLGFQTEHVATARIALGGPRFQRDTVAAFRYWDDLSAGLRGQPGVKAVGLASFVPLVNGGTGFIEIESKSFPGAGAGYRMVSDGYFDALGMKLREGRDFTSHDVAGSERVTLVNARMAAQFWPGESPLGKRVRATSMEPGLRGEPAPWLTVIGVVNDVRHFGYDVEPAPEMFTTYRQMPQWRVMNLTALVRGSGNDGDLMREVRGAVTAADPSIPADVSLMDHAARQSTATRRFAKTVLEVFGVLSVLLAGIGVYGVLSFSVAQRTREMAVRAALGADRATLLRLVLGAGGVVILAGVVVGTIGALLGARVIESLLFNVNPRDPAVIGSSALIVAAIGLAAAIIPARRATRVDPMVAMRND